MKELHNNCRGGYCLHIFKHLQIQLVSLVMHIMNVVTMLQLKKIHSCGSVIHYQFFKTLFTRAHWNVQITRFLINIFTKAGIVLGTNLLKLKLL